MKKALGKREVILGALILGLGAAVYLNWQYADIGKELAASNSITENIQEENTKTKKEKTKNYGDAKYVEGKVNEAKEKVYFAEAKLSRTKSRDEAVATLKEVLSDSSLNAEDKAKLAEKASEFAKAIEVEGKIENLIKAKGFEDCMVYLDEDKVDVVIKTQGLLDDETAQIWNIISKETNIPSENVSIIEVDK